MPIWHGEFNLFLVSVQSFVADLWRMNGDLVYFGLKFGMFKADLHSFV